MTKKSYFYTNGLLKFYKRYNKIETNYA